MTTKPALYALPVLLAAVAGCAGQAAGPASATPSPPPVSTVSTAASPSRAAPGAAPTSSPSPESGKSTRTAQPIPSRGGPTGPPDNPTDRIKPVGWVVGTVTTGGSGPCYGLTTDDGTRYAVHSTAGTKLAKGTRMQISVRPAAAGVHCGPGRQVEMIAALPLR